MITVVSGPMFSGKTTWLINYSKSLPVGSFTFYKPNIDTRYGKNTVTTHNGEEIPATNLDISDPKIPLLENHITTIFIDELNFFTDTIIDEIITQKKNGKKILGAGLNYDYNRDPFGATIALSKIADTVVPLYSQCDRCGKKAEFAYRKVKNNNQILLGAGDLYGTSCEECWELLSSKN